MSLLERARQSAPSVDITTVHLAASHNVSRCRMAGAGTSGLDPITLRVADRAVTISPGDTVTITPDATSAATCDVEFADDRAFSDFFHELRTVPGAQMAGTIRYRRGSYEHFDNWEPALRALYQGRPVYDPTLVDTDRIHQSFTHGDDSPATIGAFVREFGFAVVKGVLSRDETTAIDTAIARLARRATPDTPGSWWTVTPDGEQRPYQLRYTTLLAPEIAWIDTDPRLTDLVTNSIPDLEPTRDRENGHFAILKLPGANQGLTDLPWHTDCGLGGHTLLCPGVHIGIQLTASNRQTGAFQVLAGSHDSSVRRVQMADWPTVTVDTEPGDVTIHVPHALHAAPPPTGPGAGRRTLYVGYARPEALEIVEAGQSFDDLVIDSSGSAFVDFDAAP